METTIDRTFMREARSLIETELETLGKRLGVKFTIGSGTYTDTNGTFKLKIDILNEAGDYIPPTVTDFEKYAELYSMKPEWLGKTITIRGKKFIITGLKTSARKNKVLIKSVVTGGGFVTDVATVRRSMGED